MSPRFCLAIVTARAGSKGVPDKNIRPFAGKTLIAHTIDVAARCPLITAVMVTTDSKEIAEVCRGAGAYVPLLRPEHLATDHARQEDAIRHLMDWVETHEEPYEYIMLLMPTSPLRRWETPTAALEMVRDDASIEALYPVHRVDTNITFCNVLRPDGSMKDWVDPRYKWANRQELQTYYNLSGLYSLSKWDVFKREHTFLHDTTRSIVVDAVESLDINTPLDFFIAEELMERDVRCEADTHRLLDEWTGWGNTTRDH